MHSSMYRNGHQAARSILFTHMPSVRTAADLEDEHLCEVLSTVQVPGR